MQVELSKAEIFYFYNHLIKELEKLEKYPKSLVKDELKLHKSVIKALETADPQVTADSRLNRLK